MASIHDLTPLEFGGTVAKQGFAFQDHIASYYCTLMLWDESLKEVWCETEDDIILLWSCDGHEEVECIQAKDVHKDQLWSIALLTQRTKSSSNPDGKWTSLLEKSFRHDRPDEPCRFRLITSRDVMRELKVLKYELDSPPRKPGSPQIDALMSGISSDIKECISENGHGIDYWVSKTVWQVEQSNEAIKNKAILNIINYSMEKGALLSIERIESKIYSQIMQKVCDASCADWQANPSAKKIRSEVFKEFIAELIAQEQHPAGSGTGQDMERKMKAASIPPDYCLSAHDSRRAYRTEILSSKYMDLGDVSYVTSEINAELEKLRLELDNNTIKEGLDFYEACWKKLEDLKETLKLPNNSNPPLHFMSGCMHDLADRCIHRYMKV